jgi:hypothetical protein
VLTAVGPWHDFSRELLKLQDQLYDSLDAILDGQITATFPALKGSRIVIRVICVDAPEKEVGEFFQRFSAGIFQQDDYRKARDKCEYASDIGFSISFERSTEAGA